MSAMESEARADFDRVAHSEVPRRACEARVASQEAARHAQSVAEPAAYRAMYRS
jgi:hypothetical protein